MIRISLTINGEPIEADDYEAAAALVDADVELCEVCADEVTEELP